jgi:uncharacterized membrane protein (UPF0127 family)
VGGRDYRVATTGRSRLLGLALLDREAAGAGLLIPGCRSVHTFGMRFKLDVRFLDHRGAVISIRSGVRPWRVVSEPEAASVLELPARRD